MLSGNDVYRFTDYRAYLRSYASEIKRGNPAWSYTSWARKLGLSGASALTMVVQGQRHPGEQMAARLVQYFRFTARQREYFLDLIELQKARTNPRISLLLMEKIRRENSRRNFQLVDLDALGVLAHWYIYAIRELVAMPDFQEDPEWIQSRLRFPISTAQARQAIAGLLRLRLLYRGADGRLMRTEETFETPQDVANEALKRFHEQMSDLARQAIRSVPVHEREINGLTLCIRESQIKRAKELLRRFQDEFLEQMEADRADGDQIYQLNLSFFPLTKKSEPSLEVTHAESS